MKQRRLLFVLIASLWPLFALAEGPTFYSHQGKYTLSPGVALNIGPDESSQLLKATLTFADVDRSSSVTLNSAHPDDPFLVYWDAATKTLWWATAENIGNWDVHDQHASHGMINSRRSHIVRDDQVIGIPAEFVTKLARTLPRRP